MEQRQLGTTDRLLRSLVAACKLLRAHAAKSGAEMLACMPLPLPAPATGRRDRLATAATP